MFVITHRSFVFSAAALLTVLTAAAAAQEVPSPSDPSRQEPTSQSAVTNADDDDAALVLAEPDFRVLNLPSTLRLPRYGSNFQLTHRFNGNLRHDSGNAGNLFGLDQGAAVGFEYRFGIARHLQAAVYRTAIDKTFQFYGKYDAVRQSHSVPVSLSALLSVEGADNFQERSTCRQTEPPRSSPTPRDTTSTFIPCSMRAGRYEVSSPGAVRPSILAPRSRTRSCGAHRYHG